MTADKELRCGIKILHTGRSDPFIEECKIHDGGYAQGGDLEAMVRTDRTFFKGIFKKAVRNPLLLPRATLYALFVSLGGRWVWDKEPEEGYEADKPSLGLVALAVRDRVRERKWQSS